jgi:hypothetical protein
MLQTARRLSLPVKAVKQVGILSDARRDGLERNQPIDDWIASTVNHTHGAVAKFSKNLVFAQLLQPAPLTVSSRSGVARTARVSWKNIQKPSLRNLRQAMSEPDLNDGRQIWRVSWILVELFTLYSHNNIFIFT